MEISKEKFIEVMIDHFAGVGNEYDEEEDIEIFKMKIEEVWRDLE